MMRERRDHSPVPDETPHREGLAGDRGDLEWVLGFALVLEVEAVVGVDAGPVVHEAFAGADLLEDEWVGEVVGDVEEVFAGEAEVVQGAGCVVDGDAHVEGTVVAWERGGGAPCRPLFVLRNDHGLAAVLLYCLGRSGGVETPDGRRWLAQLLHRTCSWQAGRHCFNRKKEIIEAYRV